MKLSTQTFSLRAIRCFAFVSALVLLLFGPSTSKAYYYFYVNDGGGGHIGLVAEQIVPVGGGLLDYQYNVLNISPGHNAIDGFSVMIGVQAGLAQQVQFVPPALNPGYGSTVNPAPGGGTVPFLFSEGNTLSPVPWQFTEKDNRAGANNAYNIRWAATGGQPLPWFHYTRFDLVSTNTPVPGTGAVDPYSGPATLELDLDNSTLFTGDLGTVLVTGTDSGNPNNAFVDPSTDFNPYDNDPNINQGGIYDGVTAAAPEPATVLLGITGASLLMVMRKRVR
jgi:hypothetical protein